MDEGLARGSFLAAAAVDLAETSCTIESWSLRVLSGMVPSFG